MSMLFADVPKIEIEICHLGLFLFRFSGHQQTWPLHRPRDVGYDMQVRGGNQAATITNVSLSSPLTHMHRLRRDHHATRIPFGAYPLSLEEVPA
jgi:hypothetical protein